MCSSVSSTAEVHKWHIKCKWLINYWCLFFLVALQWLCLQALPLALMEVWMWLVTQDSSPVWPASKVARVQTHALGYSVSPLATESISHSGTSQARKQSGLVRATQNSAKLMPSSEKESQGPVQPYVEVSKEEKVSMSQGRMRLKFASSTTRIAPTKMFSCSNMKVLVSSFYSILIL